MKRGRLVLAGSSMFVICAITAVLLLTMLGQPTPLDLSP